MITTPDARTWWRGTFCSRRILGRHRFGRWYLSPWFGTCKRWCDACGLKQLGGVEDYVGSKWHRPSYQRWLGASAADAA